MAIVPTKQVSAQQAASLAAFARQSMNGKSRWPAFYIFVFSDQQAAGAFKNFQSPRGGQPLSPRDYQALNAIWPKLLVRYEYNNGSESVVYPRANTAWWTSRAGYSKVK